MKILYVSQYFPPEIGAPSARVSELAKYWSDWGHHVQVLTGFPNHPTGIVPPEYRGKLKRGTLREQYNGAQVIRTWLWPLPNRKSWERMANYSSFAISASLRGVFLQDPEIVIGTSPQLLVGLAAWSIARIKRVPFIFEVRDLWPESLDAVGIGGEQTRLYRTLRTISKFLYRNADHVVVVTPAFKDEIIRAYNAAADKISIVQNGVETELFSPAPRDPSAPFTVGYIGTMGNAHGLETVLLAAEKLQFLAPEIRFLLAGEGAERQQLANRIKANQLTNITLLPGQPREKIPALVSSTDVCLVPLKKSEVFKTVIPTKMLEFMSCGRPIILGVEGQAQGIVERAHAGLCIEPENPDALVAAILKLKMQPELARRLGINGRHYIVQNMSRQQTARDYESVLARVLGRSAQAATSN